MKTKVLFRKWHSNGEVIALFPEIPHDVNGLYCSSYERVGQHGAADIGTVTLLSDRATPSEYADLAAELTGIGYELDVKSRCPSGAFEARRLAAGA